MQMKNILVERKQYSEDKAENWLNEHREKTVYELLVMKKQLTTVDEENRDVSCNSSIWRDEDY
jgi:flagellar biosynthesis chaperone FliJ